MSTITVSNINDGTTSVPSTYVTNGSAKAWLNLNGTGTIAARDSFNASSFTDLGTGDYRQSFTTAFAAVDYTFAGSNGNDAAGNSGHRVCNFSFAGSTASYAEIVTSYIASGLDRTSADTAWVLGAFHGDLA